VGRHQLGDDRQAEAAATGVAGAGVVQADEPLQDTLAVGRRDAGPVVVHRQDHRAVPLREREADPAAGVPGGVLAEVAQHPAERVGVAVDAARRHRAGVDV
jgi:hypothetical protein